MLLRSMALMLKFLLSRSKGNSLGFRVWGLGFIRGLEFREQQSGAKKLVGMATVWGRAWRFGA